MSDPSAPLPAGGTVRGIAGPFAAPTATPGLPIVREPVQLPTPVATAVDETPAPEENVEGHVLLGLLCVILVLIAATAAVLTIAIAFVTVWTMDVRWSGTTAILGVVTLLSGLGSHRLLGFAPYYLAYRAALTAPEPAPAPPPAEEEPGA
jgi:hypothetical protein